MGVTLVMFGDVLLAGDGRVLSAPGQDVSSIFFYWYRFAFGELARGNLVLWNPYSFAGAPFLGGFQPAVLYPPNWLHLVLPTAAAINLGIALHVFLAGLGVYLWTSHRGLHAAACLLAAIVFMFCGAHFLQLYSGHVPHLCSLAWTPLIFLAIDHALDDQSPRWVLIGMAAVALQILAGNIQYVHYTAMLAALYVALALPGTRRLVRATGALAAIALGGAALAAVQLFTGWDAVTESLRAGLSYGIATSFPFPPENLATLAFPGIFGDMITTPYWGRWALHEASLFIGTAAMLLVVCGVVSGAGPAKRFSLVMALVALVLAFGDYTPLFRLLYDYCPGFQSVRAITRLTFLTSLFLAMLVAIGFDHLLSVERPPRWLAALALALGVLAGVAGATLAIDCRTGGRAVWHPTLASVSFFREAYESFVLEGSSAGGAACTNAATALAIGSATFLLLGALLLGARRSRRLVYVVGVVCALEVMVYARYSRPTFDSGPLEVRTEAMRQRMHEVGGGDARVMGAVPHFYLALSAGVHDIWAGADLVLGRYARFVARAEQWPVDAILVSAQLRSLSPLLGMLRLRYVLAVSDDDVQLEPTRLRELPRALLVSRWQVARSPEDALEAVAAPGFDPERMVVLENDPGLAGSGADDAGSVSVSDVSTDEVDVVADVRQPAILLLTDNYSAGWTATSTAADGAARYRVLPGDYTFQAIPLPPGRHTFRLEYRPLAFVIGRWVTLVALLLYAVAWAACGRRRTELTAASADR